MIEVSDIVFFEYKVKMNIWRGDVIECIVFFVRLYRLCVYIILRVDEWVSWVFGINFELYCLWWSFNLKFSKVGGLVFVVDYGDNDGVFRNIYLCCDSRYSCCNCNCEWIEVFYYDK